MTEQQKNAVNSSQSKIYLNIVEQLRLMIQADSLMPGDKIPSERELSERLQAGRSSVREALRSLELLGLIETRRGEGTFIKVFQEHRLVELLGAFFLIDKRTRKDLSDTKLLLEEACLKAITERGRTGDIQDVICWADTHTWDDHEFFQQVFRLNGNYLLERIWTVVNSYVHSSGNVQETASLHHYMDMLQALNRKDLDEAIRIYRECIRSCSTTAS
ncbi:FadR/GntR family transcriptional regulator [Peribacillus kribbensis]|uniref:FadR/GntR family transcriptional regulator n=1 Tax=Peribacillus kribbensis TaxID=356658 RepID=UPI000420011F|nr:GntR family transcriptional regulator [Peribacillus kribbensis]